MSGKNVLLILSDEHAREAAGCYGSEIVKTPHLDRLAENGTRFTHAYTNSPLCVPARASIATGRYVHETRCWSNSQAYNGSIKGWGHQLLDAGHRVVSVGKLHYRSTEDPNGFDPEIIPLHIRNGVGWTTGLLGRDGSTWDGSKHFAQEIGPGVCDYNRYDMRVTEEACTWLQTQAPMTDKPWVLCASFVTPHYPLMVPPEFYHLYPPDDLPRARLEQEQHVHPVIQAARRYYNYDDHFDDETRQIARASYFGLCTFLDHNIGRLLDTLKTSGQEDDTIIIYTSDHGELAGHHGFWTKCNMYEESAGIPMIISGPTVPRQKVVDTHASLVDIHQTILDATGMGLSQVDETLPGRSLLEIVRNGHEDRAVLSEFHDAGSITGMFMLKKEQWKFVYYPGFAPQLFDLENDPYEENDLGSSSNHGDVRSDLESELRDILDPDAANDTAFADQAARIEELGGIDGILAIGDFDQSPVPI